MDRTHFENLSSLAKSGSWAIWDENEPSNPSIIEESIKVLHTKVIIVGLNKSNTLGHNWQNYHGGKHDRKLMYAFNKSSYRGAYMTDLISNTVTKSAKGLFDRENEDSLCHEMEKFHDEMKKLSVGSNTLFILLGRTVKDLFFDKLSVYYHNAVAIPHHSSTQYKDYLWVERVWQKINSHIKIANDAGIKTKEFQIYREMEPLLNQLKKK